MGCRSYVFVGLECIKRQNQKIWREKFFVTCSYAHCIHRSNFGKQRVYRALYVKYLLEKSFVWRVSGTRKLTNYLQKFSHFPVHQDLRVWIKRKVNFFFLKVVNHHLLRDLVDRGLWDEDMKNELILNNGSVQVCVRMSFRYYITLDVLVI